MPSQDLTPRLRTRLSRLERVVGLFVAVALLLLVIGLAFYVYRVADRRGWFVRKLPYFTFVRSAAGLNVGDPVRMMGFTIGEITTIEAQPPFDPYDVFVRFTVRDPYEGYLWEDSHAVIAATDFLGKRTIELTKGTNGAPTYTFHPLRVIPLGEAPLLVGSTNLALAQDLFSADSATGVLARAFQKVTADQVRRFAEARVEELLVVDQSIRNKWPTGKWDYKNGRYQRFNRESLEDEKGFYLEPEEAPALTARLEQLANTVEAALPNILGLTNPIQRVLNEAAGTATRATLTLSNAEPLVVNLTRISASLTNGPGALGEFLLPPGAGAQLTQTLAGAAALMTNSDHQVTDLSSNLTTVILNLASITSNLNVQVTANTNVLERISRAVVDADTFIQGLKRHWLLRSAFKEENRGKADERGKGSGRTGPAVEPRRATAPKYSEPRR